MISNVAQLYVGHYFTRVVMLTVNASYAHNVSTQTSSYKIDTIRGLAVLDYKLTRSTKLSLSQEYNHFSYPGTPDFDKLVTMLAVSIEWQ